MSALMKPFDKKEIKELATSTLHGSLPTETQMRLMATVVAQQERIEYLEREIAAPRCHLDL